MHFIEIVGGSGKTYCQVEEMIQQGYRLRGGPVAFAGFSHNVNIAERIQKLP